MNVTLIFWRREKVGRGGSTNQKLLELSVPLFKSFNECLKCYGVKNPPAEVQIILKVLLLNWSGPLISYESLSESCRKKFLEHGLDNTEFWFDLEFFPILKWGCYCILKLNSLDTLSDLHLKVWDEKLPLKVWKLCNLVFLLLSFRDFTHILVKWACMSSVAFIQGARALDKT